MTSLQKKIEKKLYDFTDVLDLSICDHCIEFSQNQNVLKQHIECWIFDTEHGLLHSFLVAFFAYQEVLKTHSHNQIEENWFKKLMASCLLHDFVRCTENDENHDQRLKEYFPELIPDVYTHADPPKETPLVIGDRIELRRFEDWELWINGDIKQYTNENEVIYLYENIRPVLKQLFENRYIDHTKGIEKKLAIKILSCTERIIERIKFLI